MTVSPEANRLIDLVFQSRDSPTLPARNPVLREHLFAAGFTEAGPDRVRAPKGMNRKKAKSAFSKVFLANVIRETDAGHREDAVVGFVPVLA